jgi:hypothetical protein
MRAQVATFAGCPMPSQFERRQAPKIKRHIDKQKEMYKMQKFKECVGLYFISSHYHGEKVQPWNGM